MYERCARRYVTVVCRHDGFYEQTTISVGYITVDVVSSVEFSAKEVFERE
jgi:hypothetical protein